LVADISNSEYLPFLLYGNIDINQGAANKGGTTIILVPGITVKRLCQGLFLCEQRARVHERMQLRI